MTASRIGIALALPGGIITILDLKGASDALCRV
jgi:hypothetical protein